jgi:hypothetical protein
LRFPRICQAQQDALKKKQYNKQAFTQPAWFQVLLDYLYQTIQFPVSVLPSKVTRGFSESADETSEARVQHERMQSAEQQIPDL